MLIRNHADTVYLVNTGLFKSVDGGKNFNLLPARHGDHHGLWIDPTNPNRIANVSDGGASVSIDGGKTLDHAKQPADRAILSRRCGQCVSLSHLRRATGQLERLHRQPHRLGRDRATGLVRSGRWRMRLRRAGPARLAHHLFKQRRLHQSLR